MEFSGELWLPPKVQKQLIDRLMPLNGPFGVCVALQWTCEWSRVYPTSPQRGPVVTAIGSSKHMTLD